LCRTESELFLEVTHASNRIFDRVDPFLKDDLLRGMFELLVGQHCRCAIVPWPPPL
jgi:hypothetical protein